MCSAFAYEETMSYSPARVKLLIHNMHVWKKSYWNYSMFCVWSFHKV